jgi:hypothetical protein
MDLQGIMKLFLEKYVSYDSKSGSLLTPVQIEFEAPLPRRGPAQGVEAGGGATEAPMPPVPPGQRLFEAFDPSAHLDGSDEDEVKQPQPEPEAEAESPVIADDV